MRPRVVIGAGVILGALIVIAVLAFFANQELYLTVDELVANPELYAVAAAEPAWAAPGTAADRAAAAPGTGADSAGEPPQGLREADRVSVPGRRLQVRGTVDDATVVRPDEGLMLRFTLAGDTGRVPVSYGGLVPDTFDQAETVTVAGYVGRDGVFEADELLVQCPSKYEAVPPGATAGAR